MKFSSVLRLSLSLLLLAVLVACGGGSKDQGPPNVQISVAPFQISLDAGQTQQFTATVTGSTNTAVTWSLSGTSCTGTACGTIDGNGLYTAPALIPSDATVKVSATSQANTGVTVSSTATLKALVVTMNTKTYSMDAGEAYTLSATVTHHTNTALTWSMSATGCTGAACGTFNSNTGMFTAPSLIPTQATVTITATSAADPTKSDTCTLTLVPISVSISPTSGALDGGQSLQFAATVNHHTNIAVTWSVSGSNAGSIDNAGRYSAPYVIASATTATVWATSVADPTKSASATVTLTPLVITIAPNTATLGGGQTQQFAASIAHHANKAVTWSLSGAGSLSTAGLYSAPAVVAAQATATVRVTSVVDPSRWASAVITLIPVTVVVAPTTATVPVSGTQQFHVTVTGTSNTAVTWSVSGTGCSGNSCGTVDSTGLYTAPSSAPNPATVTVTATSAADMTKSAAATVSIATNANAVLNGHYAVRFMGFDAAGKKVAAIGSFTADGQGNITNGRIDYNSVAGNRNLQTPFTATYQVGGDHRGVLTTNLAYFSGFQFVVDGSGDTAYLTEFDSSGQRGSGMIQKQTTTDFQLSRLAGDAAFAMTGCGLGGERNVAIGRFHSDTAGAVTNGRLDSKMAGETATSNMAFTATLAMDSAYGATHGRGTLTISMAGGLALVRASFYMVDAEEWLLITTDTVGLNAPLLIGTALRQLGGPYSASSWSGTTAYYMTGATGQPQAPAVHVGYMEPDGTQTMYVEYSRNWTGSIWEFGNGTAAYSIDSGGRGSLTSNTFGNYVFYLVSQNTGFLLDSGTGLEEVNFGKFERQVVPSGGFKNTTFTGDFLAGTVEMPTSNAAVNSGFLTWDGTAAVAGVMDISRLGGNSAGESVAGAYAVTGSPARANDGKGTVNYTQPSISKSIFYPVTDSRMFMISVDPGNDAATVTVLDK